MSSSSSAHGGGGRIPRLYTPKNPRRARSRRRTRGHAVTPAVLLPGLAALAASALAAAFGLAPCAASSSRRTSRTRSAGLKAGRGRRGLRRLHHAPRRRRAAPGAALVLVLVAGPWKRRRALAALILAAAAHDAYVDGFVVRRWPLAVGVFVMAHVVNVARTYRRSKYVPA